MKKLVRFARGYGKNIALVILLLAIQAFCDLSLPNYTSKIVDVGIQNSGIEHITPEEIRTDSMDLLQLFMTEDEVSLINSRYEEKEGGILCLTKEGEKGIDESNNIFLAPILAVSASGDKAASLTPEMAQAARPMIEEQVQALGDSMAEQTAISWLKTEYEACGIDLGAMQSHYLWNIGIRMIALSFLMLAAAISAGFLASRIGAGISRNLRRQVFGRVLSFSSSEMDKFSTASLITRCTNDIQQIQMVMILMLRMVLYAPIIGIGGVIRVASTNTSMSWVIALAVLIILGLVGVLVSVAMPRFKKMPVLIDRLNLVTREILTGIPVIRAFSRERHEEERFQEANMNLMKNQLFVNRVMAFMMPSMMLVMNGITVLIIWVGSHQIDLGSLQVGDMMAFITYTMQIVMAFLMLTMLSIMLPRAIVSADRIQEVLDTSSCIRNPENPETLSVTKGILCFEHVNFRYPNAEEDVLHDISFTACPGQTTAIIGSTGSGKSSLINLIPRLYDVTGGRITLDGTDIRDLSLHDLREQIGFVPQKAILFSGSIADNIRYGKPEAADFTVQQAAEIAQASEFINEKPEGYTSWIAQGGSNVSGGQKQRLSIARAIAKDPAVYLFDDSFSALDYKTDLTLRKELQKAAGGRTQIIVAQRISTILHADQILVLDDGRIAGMGTHEELLQSCDAYREIAESQLSAAELAASSGKEEAHE